LVSRFVQELSAYEMLALVMLSKSQLRRAACPFYLALRPLSSLCSIGGSEAYDVGLLMTTLDHVLDSTDLASKFEEIGLRDVQGFT
jgi:hypothetical protein